MRPCTLKRKIQDYRTHVGRRTRGKTEVINKAIAEADDIPSTSRRNAESAPEDNDSGVVPAPIPPSARRNKAKLQDFSSLRNTPSVRREKALVRASSLRNTPSARRIMAQLRASFSRLSSNVEIADIEEAPRRKVGRPKGSLGRRKRAAMGNAKPTMNIGSIEEIHKVDFYRVKKRRRHSAIEETSEGKENADLDSEEIDKIVDEEFTNRTMSKAGSSSKEETGEEMVPGILLIEEIDEAEFRNKAIHAKSRRGQSPEQGDDSNTSASKGGKSITSSGMASSESKSKKNADIVEELPANNCRGKFIFEDPDRGSDKGQTDKSRSFTEEVNQDGRKSRSKETNRAEFSSGKSRSSSRLRSSARQGSSAAIFVDELPADADVRGHFTSEYAGSGSDKGRTDQSRSFTEKGNNGEDIDPNELDVIDEPDIMKRTQFATEERSSSWQEPDGVHVASTSRKNVKSVSKEKFSNGKGCRNKKERKFVSNSKRMRKDESWNKNVHNDDNDSSDEHISSDPGSNSSSDNASTYLPDDEIISDGAKHETNLGVAAGTRSKKMSAEKPKEVAILGPDSQYYEAKCANSVDGGEELCTNDKTCDVRNNVPRELSARKGRDCSKQEGSVAKHAPNRRHQNPHNKESNCEQRTSQKRKFPSRKRQLITEASTKQTKRRKSHQTCEVNEENEEKNIISDSKTEDDLNERSTLPKSTCPEQSYAQNSHDEAKGVDGLHPKDQPEAGIMMQKKEVSSSHSKDDHNYIDDDDDNDDDDEEEEEDEGEEDCNGDIPEKTEATEHGTDEIKEPTRRKQVFSGQHDFCSRLADAILGNEPLLETEGIDEEAFLAPPSQPETTLPLKFRFEDDVPKEVVKTEYEKEIERLFSELDSCCALGELGSCNFSEDDQENENPPAVETHHARCTRGKHELILKDDEGLICMYCHHVELGPKDILPDWAEKTRLGRKRYHEAVQPDFDELYFQHSVNAADYGNAGDGSVGDGTVWSLKAGIRDSMYEHQREGFEFLWKNLAGSIYLEELKSSDREVGGCIISHAPGTGKTRLTINFIETYLRMFPKCMPVIISPASMLLTWEEEFRKWNVGFPFLNLNNPEFVGPEMKVLQSRGRGGNSRNQDARRLLKIWLWSKGRSILGISYSLFGKLAGEKYLRGKKNKGIMPLNIQKQQMRKILLEKPGLVVLDEGHTPRNRRSNIWNALFKLETAKRVILSGTPFQNNFAELFNILRLVRPAIADMLTQERAFAEMIAARRVPNSQNYSQSLDELKLNMNPFVHVHKGTILQQSLPGLRDCVILLKPSALQKSLIERLEGSSTFEFEHRVALISVHPYLLVHSDLPEEQGFGIDMAAIEASKLKANEGVKIKFILELVRLSLVLNEKVLIFSQYIQPLGLIKEHLKECFKWADGKEILQMEGKLEQKQRQVLINAFNDPKNESKVMLGSTRCCSEGISLIGASRVVLLDVVWNPSVERQAISRAYRIGQKKFVYTYHLMTSGTTEADKYCRQAEKERLSELVFTSSSNEGKNQKQPAVGIEDRVLEEMVSNVRLKEMFDKIINQPKDINLIQTFGLT